MFEYYKWKLANKPTGIVEAKKEEEIPTLGTKVWIIALLLALAFSNFIVFAPSGGALTLTVSVVSMAVLLIWLVMHLIDISWKKLAIKLIQFSAVLVLVILLLGLLFGGIAVITHNMMRSTHNLGQIATRVDLITRSIVLFIIPVVIITFFRFTSGRSILTKIRRKTYLELLIILAIGLLISQIPNAVVLRTLMLTQLLQFMILTIINTLLITAIITTCRNREVLK